MFYIIHKDELTHYGVKGMKWGIRKDKEKEGKRRGSIKQFVSKHPYMTAGATAAVALLALYGSKKVLNLYKEGYFTEQYKASDILKILPTSSDFDMKVTNDIPGVSKSLLDKISKGPIRLQSLPEREQSAFNKAMKDGYFTNCAHCTTAAALRRKGYDVVATNSISGHHTKDVLRWWNGSKIEKAINLPGALSAESKEEKIKVLEKLFETQPTGSYGDLHVSSFFSGHSIQYNITKSGIKINDYQVRRTYDSLKDFFDDYPEFDPVVSSCIRLDNCKPNIEQMLKDHIIKPR